MVRERTLSIEVSPGETRAAVSHGDGTLLEFHVQRMGTENLAGAILSGRVTRVEKGMGAAFVEIGAAQAGFIGKAKNLTEGESVVVQIQRPAGGGKGPVLTVSPALAGRYLVLYPTRADVDWPRSMEKHRTILQPYLRKITPEGMSLAPRPPAAGIDETVLAAESSRLRDLWEEIGARAAASKPPQILAPAPSLIDGLLRDATGPVVIDDPKTFSRLRAMAAREMPDLADRLALYKGDAPMFDQSGIEEQLEAALSPDAPLPGGGGLVIETIEALTAIDVNLGNAGGRLPSEAAIFKANQKAAAEAARQIALRNIAGLIVIDFISMRNKGNRRKIVDAMRGAMRDDPVRHDVLGMTYAGLVEITRQRTGRPLAACFLDGIQRGYPVLPEAEACRALRAALRRAGGGKPVLAAGPRVIAALKGPLEKALVEVNRRLGQELELRPEHDRGSSEFRWERKTDS